MDSVFLDLIKEYDEEIEKNYRKICAIEDILDMLRRMKIFEGENQLKQVIKELKYENGIRLHVIMQQKKNMVKNENN